MNPETDSRLLRSYAEDQAEAAFAELARRYVDFVYSAALRLVRDPHLAEDVTQGVFVALAKGAAQLAERPVISGWLHCTARNIAAQTVRGIERRRAREQEAAAMNELLAAGPEATWEQITPHLDAALGELDETGRDAVLLRYFEKKSAAEMADVLGISAEAAQKRVGRAVERLREFFSKRKVTIGASGLVILISANAVQSAPAGLVAAVSAAALAGTALSTSTALATTTKVIAMTTLQKTFAIITVAALASAGIYEAHRASQLRDRVQALQQQQAPLAEQVRQLQEQLNRDSNTISRLNEERAGQEKNHAELLTLRGQVGALRSRLNEATLAAAKTQPAAAPSGAAGVGDQNQAMLDFLGSPILPPANLAFAYTKQGLLNAVQSAAQSANITLAKVEIDDSEFPFLVGVVFQSKGDYEKLKGELLKLPQYNYSGSASGDGAAAMDITPYNSYPAGAGQAIHNRKQVRQAMLYDRIKPRN